MDRIKQLHLYPRLRCSTLPDAILPSSTLLLSQPLFELTRASSISTIYGLTITAGAHCLVTGLLLTRERLFGVKAVTAT
ncbi:hypothetical protein BKA66DRAFT_157563 [Pyrenochaeta sp. MPI-SDFR-AT-0127]|nr:hypothetical protein BKA66DRAFT_157563 [Pyrenochaeta sp. MPI-SDFR-AT-0127]